MDSECVVTLTHVTNPEWRLWNKAQDCCSCMSTGCDTHTEAPGCYLQRPHRRRRLHHHLHLCPLWWHHHQQEQPERTVQRRHKHQQIPDIQGFLVKAELENKAHEIRWMSARYSTQLKNTLSGSPVPSPGQSHMKCEVLSRTWIPPGSTLCSHR